MSLNQDFILMLTRLIGDYVTNSSLEKASSEQKQIIPAEQKKEVGVIKRVIDWFLSLFK